MIEQRSEPRTRTHLFGRIVYGRDRSVCDCLVSDLSGGARLSLAYTSGIPEEFELHIPSRGLVCQVFVAWRLRREFGVKFLSVSARAVGSARSRWSFPVDAQRSPAWKAPAVSVRRGSTVGDLPYYT
jgi:hypothetical protein